MIQHPVTDVLLRLLLLQEGNLWQEDIKGLRKILADQGIDNHEDAVWGEDIQHIVDQIHFDREAVELETMKVIESIDKKLMMSYLMCLERCLEELFRVKYGNHRLMLMSIERCMTHPAMKLEKAKYTKILEITKAAEFSTNTTGHQQLAMAAFANLAKEDLAKGNLWAMMVHFQVLSFILNQIPRAERKRENDKVFFRVISKYFKAEYEKRVEEFSRPILALTGNNPWVPIFFFDEIDPSMGRAQKQELINNVFEIKADLEHPAISEILKSSLMPALKFTKHERAKVLYRATSDEEFHEHELHVIKANDEGECHFRLSRRQVEELRGDMGDGFSVKIEDENSLSLQWGLEGNQGQRRLIDNEELVAKGWCMIAKPSRRELALLPLERSALSVSSLSCEIGGHSIFKPLDFVVEPGTLNGICGVSGCGKTTLMMVLAGLVGEVKGDIHYGYTKLNHALSMRDLSTFVSQDDVLFKELSVSESIQYAAELKVHGKQKDLKSRRDDVISALGLEGMKHLVIGDENRKGISGGQRKRVNIGTSIVGGMKPILLFDEPTSSLDPLTALEIVRILRQLSRRGHIVFVVTHDLYPDLTRYFDRFLIMSPEGELLHTGSPNSIKEMFEIPDLESLYEKMVQSDMKVFKDRYARSVECRELHGRVRETQALTESRIDSGSRHFQGHSVTSRFGVNFQTFLKRDLRRKSKDSQYVISSLLQPLFISMVIGLYFSGPLAGAIFSLVVSALWIGAISGVKEINGEWAQSRRDIHDGANLYAYYLSKEFGCFIASGLQVVILTICVMIFHGYLSEPYRFAALPLFFVLLLVNFFGVGLGLVLSSLMRSTTSSITALPVVLIPLLIMGGSLFPHSEASGIKRWVMWFNPVRVTYEAALLSGQNILYIPHNKEERSAKDVEEQQAKWREYEASLARYEKDPEAYRQKHGTDINSALGSIMGKGASQRGPEKPVSVEDPELLMSRPELWREGYQVLPVDHAEANHLLDFSAKDYFSLYAITAPDAFASELSAQGLLGMYEWDVDGEKAWSAYSSFDYFLLLCVLKAILVTMSLTTLHYRMKIGIRRGVYRQ